MSPGTSSARASGCSRMRSVGSGSGSCRDGPCSAKSSASRSSSSDASATGSSSSSAASSASSSIATAGSSSAAGPRPAAARGAAAHAARCSRAAAARAALAARACSAASFLMRRSSCLSDRMRLEPLARARFSACAASAAAAASALSFSSGSYFIASSGRFGAVGSEPRGAASQLARLARAAARTASGGRAPIRMSSHAARGALGSLAAAATASGRLGTTDAGTSRPAALKAKRALGFELGPCCENSSPAGARAGRLCMTSDQCISAMARGRCARRAPRLRVGRAQL